jgi:HlyD family secretion protein
MNRRLRRWVITLAVIAVVFFGIRAVTQPKPIEVEGVTVGVGPVEDVVANSEGGTVKARFQARLGAERAGRVQAIPYREGANVARGAVLLRLDPSTAQTRAEVARRDLEALAAAVGSARAAETLARQAFERAEPLGQQGLLSPEQMDETRARLVAAAADLRAAEARRASAESAVRLADDELAHHLVRAPFAGVVTRRFVEVGEPVIPGQAVLELVSLDRLYVSASIDERDAGRITPGLPARVTLDAYPGHSWPARVSRVAPMIETAKEQNRTLEIELDVPHDPMRPAPRPGMTADAEVVLDRRESVLRVPSLAVIEGREVLVDEGGRARERTIETGVRNWQWTEVLAGLQRGDRVITSLDRTGLKAGVAIRMRAAGVGEAAAPDTGAAAVIP